MNRIAGVVVILVSMMLSVAAHAATKFTSFKINPVTANALKFTVSLSAADTVALSCNATLQVTESHLPPALAGASSYSYTLYGLRAETPYSCCAKLGSSAQKICRSVLTPPLPIGLQDSISVAGDSTALGNHYFIFNDNYYMPIPDGDGNPNTGESISAAYAVITDPQGNVRWYLKREGASNGDLSYIGNNQIAGEGWVDDGYTIVPAILDFAGNVKWTPSTEISNDYELADTFNHDFGISETGDSVFTILFGNVPQGQSGEGFVLKEIGLEPNEPVWYWEVTENGINTGALPAPIEPEDCDGDGESLAQDMYHANSVQDVWETDPVTGALHRYVYASLRDLNQVLKIDYDTKALVWKLGVGGNFTLLEADGTPADVTRWFFGQHDAQRLVNGSVTVYDNGPDEDRYCPDYTRAYSRALRLEIDEAAMTATIAWEHTEENWFDPVFGSVDWLKDEDIYLVNKTGKFNAVNAQGQIVTTVSYSPGMMSYRLRPIDGCDIFYNSRYCSELSQ